MIHAAPTHVVLIPHPVMGVEMIHAEMIHAEMIHVEMTHVVLIPYPVMTHVNNLPAKQHCPQRHPQRQLLKAQLRRRLSLGQI